MNLTPKEFQPKAQINDVCVDGVCTTSASKRQPFFYCILDKAIRVQRKRSSRYQTVCQHLAENMLIVNIILSAHFLEIGFYVPYKPFIPAVTFQASTQQKKRIFDLYQIMASRRCQALPDKPSKKFPVHPCPDNSSETNSQNVPALAPNLALKSLKTTQS